MCIKVYVRYSYGHKGQHLGHKPCYHAQMIEAYNKPDSKVILKNPIEHYNRECENCSSEEYVEKKKACGVCVLAAKGLKTLEEENEIEGHDTLKDLEKWIWTVREGTAVFMVGLDWTCIVGRLDED